ncbi:FAD-binding oxidoreductase [Acidipila sp. 4G-K13]|uniref:FAD-binding oxidoreductase n=2 Tax=Paracidobacterium acidisoli TaxID=2303751 RepID=A0A372IKD8_9BACT|nr:FAD-binding oxidoreductase [Paracidobacterium acidisoli]
MRALSAETVFDAVIAGAGIVGAACALECAQRGLRVAVVESRAIAGGATGAAMGHIVALDDSPMQLALTRWSQRLWSELAPRLPESAQYRECGTIWLARDEQEMEEVRRKKRTFDAAGIPAEVLDGDALAGAEPHLARPLAGGLMAPLDAVVQAASATEWLVAEAARLGAKLYLPQTVTEAREGRVLLRDGTALRARWIVLAGGTDGLELTPALPIRRRKGHLILAECAPGFMRHQLVELGYLKSAHALEGDSVAFNVQPRPPGQILIGSSRQYDAAGDEVEERIVTEMLERAEAFLPGVRELRVVRMWTGFRAATADKLPLIGPWGEDATLFVANGHEGLGITTSLATARLLVDRLLGERSPIDSDAYLPSRFAGHGGRA